jgi:hypothetical protein
MSRRKVADDPQRPEKVTRVQELMRSLMAKQLREQGSAVPDDPEEFRRVRPTYAAIAGYINQSHDLPSLVQSQNIDHWINGKYLPQDDNLQKLGLAWGFPPEVAGRNIDDYIRGVRDLDGRLIVDPNESLSIALSPEAWDELRKVSLATAIRVVAEKRLISINPPSTSLSCLFQLAGAIAQDKSMCVRLLAVVIREEVAAKGEDIEAFRQAGGGAWNREPLRTQLDEILAGTLPENRLDRTLLASLAYTLQIYTGNPAYSTEGLMEQVIDRCLRGQA